MVKENDVKVTGDWIVYRQQSHFQESLNKTLTDLTEEKQRMKLNEDLDEFSDSSDTDQSERSKDYVMIGYCLTVSTVSILS